MGNRQPVSKILFIFLILWGLFFIVPVQASEGETEKDHTEENQSYTMYDDVDLVSTLKFTYGKPKIIIKSVYPQIESGSDADDFEPFNDLILAMVDEEIAAFQEQVKAQAAKQKGLPSKQITNNLYLDYAASYLTANKQHLISIRFSMRGDITGLDKPYRRHRVLNYNLDEQQLLQLSDLFAISSDYLTLLSQYANQALTRYLPKSFIAEGAAPLSENYQNWNMKPNGLLITFDENKVAPTVFGAQTVLIPYAALISMISPESPIADCVKNPKRCRQSNVLTGGFIDEARIKTKASVFPANA